MDIKSAYKALIEEGLSPEEAFLQLKAKLDDMLTKNEIEQEDYDNALNEIQPSDEDRYAERAEQLLEEGEFDDFDEAYDFALDELGEEGVGVKKLIENAAADFIDGEIDENQLVELLKQIKGEGGAPENETPLE